MTKDNVGLGDVDNTSDADKPVSTAQQTALNNKADKDTDAVVGNFASFDAVAILLIVVKKMQTMKMLTILSSKKHR